MANDDDDVIEVRTVKTEPAVSMVGAALTTIAFAFCLGLIIFAVKYGAGG